MKNLFAFFLLIAGTTAFAQEAYTLHLMNGQELPVYSLNDTAFTELRFTFDKNHFKRERRHIAKRRKIGDFFNPDITAESAEKVPVVMREGERERGEVFAAVLPDGTEKLYYYYSEEDGNYLTEDQMRSFIAGQGDAHVAVRGRGWLLAGVGVGAAAGYAARGSILALAVPPVFALSTRIPTLRIRERSISNMKFQYDDYYAAGFETQARSKHLREALKGSVIGTIIGLAVYAVIDNNR